MDKDQNGILDELEFTEFVKSLGIEQIKENDIQKFLLTLDPYNHK